MPILGAHMSISGGYYKAVERAREVGCDCVQLFTKNNNQWRAKPITAEDERRFAAALREQKIQHPLSHTSYLINLASPDKKLRKKSVDALVVELQRAEQLGIPYVVLHPGAHTTATEVEGLEDVVRSLDEVHARTADLAAMILLENTAGQGSTLGHTFEQLAVVIDGVEHSGRLGVCLDTCHAFAAGYPLTNASDYQRTIDKLDKAVGLERVKAIHLNDSKRELGSRVDRHEHIGYGQLGVDAFRHLVNDPRFASVPMYLETAKEEKDGESWDVINLRALRRLVSVS